MDLSENSRALREINPSGGIPTFVINGRVKRGFSPAGLSAAIRQAAGR